MEEMPNTFEEAVDWVAARIEPGSVDQPWFHLTGGMNVRNALGLWQKDSSLYKHMQERFGLCHADDTGGLICSAADAKVKGRQYDPTPDVERYKEHWRSYGYDPATMERLRNNA